MAAETFKAYGKGITANNANIISALAAEGITATYSSNVLTVTAGLATDTHVDSGKQFKALLRILDGQNCRLAYVAAV